MNFVFAGFMVVTGIGAGLIVSTLVVGKERAQMRKEVSDLESKLLNAHDDLDKQIDKVRNLYQKCLVLEGKLKHEANRASYFEKHARILEQQMAQKKTGCNVEAGDKEMIAKALKKAMVSAHPDRNNGRDDGSFQKYNELYKKYK